MTCLTYIAAATAKSLQYCPTLCDPIDGSPPGSPVPGILQARTLEWVAVSFSNAWRWKVKVKSPSHLRLFTTPWIAAHQALPPMGFSRQEYWSGLPLPSPWLTLGSIKTANFLNCQPNCPLKRNSRLIWQELKLLKILANCIFFSKYTQTICLIIHFKINITQDQAL